MPAFALVAISIILGAAGQILMKLGTTRIDLSAQDTIVRKLLLVFMQPSILIGLACYGISAVLWIFGLSKMQLSQAYPMVAASYVIVFIFAALLFKEPMTAYKLGGLALIVAGVVLLAKS